MIDLMLKKSTDLVLIRISGHNLTFSKVMGGRLASCGIDGLKFDVRGVLKQFPDLEGKDNKEIIDTGKQRFKEHIKSMPNEISIMEYIIKDLAEHQYIPQYYQRAGFRTVKCPQQVK